MFYRLIPPPWLKEKSGAQVEEGIFETDYIFKKNQDGYGVYWFPNHPSNKSLYSDKRYISGKDIDTFKFLFVDMDLKDEVYHNKVDFLKEVNRFDLEPSMVVDSGNGVHVYWKVSDLNRESYVKAQLRLIKHFKTDESVWTVMQLMRLPNSVNTKDKDNYKNADVIFEAETVYQTEDFDILNRITVEDLKKADNHIDKLEGRVQVQLADDVNIDELPDSFIDIMIDNPAIYNLFNDPTSYGDRSSADMKLINYLYSKDIPKKDALCVAANTKKALDKGNHRFDYAHMTVDKAYVGRTKNLFPTVEEMLKIGGNKSIRELVHGPKFFDCLHFGWAKKQVLGLVAGSGVGKTAMTLKVFNDMISNNLDNDDVFVFFSLEMPAEEIVERWVTLSGNDTSLHKRLIVISNEDIDGEPRNIGLQEIYEYCSDIKKASGKNIGSLAIDHIGIISHHIDTRKKYTFGINNEHDNMYGEIRSLSINNICTQMKVLAKMLNTFVIILTQTTKEKGTGYRPIEKDAAYGVSQYENIVDYMIGLWQPIMLVANDCPTKFLGWQYCKIRNKHKNDPMSTNEYKTLVYDLNNGDIRIPSSVEQDAFREMMPHQIEAAKNKEKNTETAYSRSISKEELDKIDQKLRLITEEDL